MSSDAAESKALLSFFLGPVQPFIAGARTTRDLWTGSYLLAWLTFTAISKVRETPGATLLSPNLEGNPFLWTRDDKARRGAPPSNITTPCIPNRFIAEIPAGAKPHEIAAACEKACHDEWKEIADEVHAALSQRLEEHKTAFVVPINGRDVNLLATPWDRLWLSQVKSFFEVRTAVLYPDHLPADLRSGRTHLDVLAGLMDARKSVRHVPDYHPSGDVPQKCTLLGTYEQMGPARLDESRAFWHVFAKYIRTEVTRVREGERLCAVSLVKRYAWAVSLADAKRLDQPKDELSYSDTATVAAGCWLPDEQEAPDEGVNWKTLKRWSGQWLHWQRPDQDEDEKPCPPKVWNWIQQRKRDTQPPPAYFAILMADADKLGEKLARDPSGASRALTIFALHRVEGIVEKHRGELIYSGGDDTLAVLPTEEALACGTYVRREYADNWRQYVKDGSDGTISAGVAIVHYKEDLRFALDLAREAESTAKRSGRNALALTVCRRSGELTTAVMGWDQVPQLQQLVRLFLGNVSDRWAYKLRASLPTLQALPWDAFRGEVDRLLGRLDRVTLEQRRATSEQVLEFLKDYGNDMRPKKLVELRQKKGICTEAEADGAVMADFVTLCQSASFLARGRDTR